MKKIDLGQTIGILANLGVIAGLVFLIVELEQSNRISSYTAENSRRSQFIEFNSFVIANPEIYAKLQLNNADLTPPERAQALMLARSLINGWRDAESAYAYGLLSERTFEITMLDISVVFDEAPGLIPFFSYLIEAYELENDDSSPVSNRVTELVRLAGH